MLRYGDDSDEEDSIVGSDEEEDKYTMEENEGEVEATVATERIETKRRPADRDNTEVLGLDHVDQSDISLYRHWRKKPPCHRTTEINRLVDGIDDKKSKSDFALFFGHSISQTTSRSRLLIHQPTSSYSHYKFAMPTLALFVKFHILLLLLL